MKILGQLMHLSALLFIILLSTNISAFADENSMSKKPKLRIEDYVFPLTRDQYPDYYKKWGSEGFKRINAMLAPALKKAYASPQCSSISYVGFASDRSEKDKKLTVFVDCENKDKSREDGRSYFSDDSTRFYFTEDDLKVDGQTLSARDQLEKISDSEAIGMCEESLKENLTHRSTFASSWFGPSVMRSAYGNMVVTIEFEAKNSFNLALKFIGRCYFDERGVMQKPEIAEK